MHSAEAVYIKPIYIVLKGTGAYEAEGRFSRVWLFIGAEDDVGLGGIALPCWLKHNASRSKFLHSASANKATRSLQDPCHPRRRWTVGPSKSSLPPHVRLSPSRWPISVWCLQLHEGNVTLNYIICGETLFAILWFLVTGQNLHTFL